VQFALLHADLPGHHDAPDAHEILRITPSPHPFNLCPVNVVR
jgi:hypothetical protein